MASLENVNELTDDEFVPKSPLKPKAKAKTQSAAKAKAKPSSGSKGMKRPAASFEMDKVEESEAEPAPSVSKRPAGNLKNVQKKPAAEPKPKREAKKAYKYLYKDGKWGIRLNATKKEICTVQNLALGWVQLDLR